jgi:hypothetical protein
VSYFHVVFTLPAAIANIAYQNKAAIYDILFTASAETMVTIAADPKHLGARIGFRQLGSSGQVLSDRVADLLAHKGLRDARLTDEIDALENDPRLARARDEMDDRRERRIQHEARELDRMRKLLEDSRKRVGVEMADLKAVFTTLNAAVAAKRLELLHEMVPAATSIGYLVNPTNPIDTRERNKGVTGRGANSRGAPTGREGKRRKRVGGGYRATVLRT